MAIDTNNEKLALMEEGLYFEPGLPLSPGTLGADDKQQLLWGYPGILWPSVVIPVVVERTGRLAVIQIAERAAVAQIARRDTVVQSAQRNATAQRPRRTIGVARGRRTARLLR